MFEDLGNQLIVIEGVIGVGKTSFAKLLAHEFGAELLLENAEENPFLPSFYRDRKKWAFQSQIFFLLSRVRQLEELAQQSLFTKTMVTDYFLPKDRIFAYANLSEQELILYEQIYKLLNLSVPQPDLVVFLQADTETLLRRIRARGRGGEQQIDADYLSRLNEAYNRFFFYYEESPLLVVQTNEMNLIDRPSDLTDLIGQIKRMNKGKRYYNFCG